MTIDQQDLILTSKEICVRLGNISRPHFYKLLKKHGIKATKISATWQRYRWSDFQFLIADNKK